MQKSISKFTQDADRLHSFWSDATRRFKKSDSEVGDEKVKNLTEELTLAFDGWQKTDWADAVSLK